MGKKRISILGSSEEEQHKAKQAVKLQQKKMRQGKTAKAPGLKGGQRVVDTTAQSLVEYEQVQAKLAAKEAEKPKKKSHLRSPAYQAARAKIDSQKTYSLDTALSLLRQTSLTKFDPTVELHLVLKVTPKSQLEITLPHSSGKSKQVAVADDKVISQIESGHIDFDILLASPDQMPKLVKFAKVLGPRGLMPNPKSGTIVDNPAAAVKKFSSDKSLNLKAEKDAPLIHTTVGKLSMSDSDLSENLTAILSVVSPLARKVILKSTMSPAIKITL